jgi:hypothetical protein
MIPTADFTRNVANALVERAERQTGSRMAAYEMVAQTVGTSSSWLRKFIKGQEAKEPGWTTGWNILDQYSRICDRVEAEIETERAKILALKEQIDAANTIANRVAEGSTHSPQAGKRGSDASRDVRTPQMGGVND